MKKKIEYKENKLVVTFDFSKEALRTLYIVKSNDGVAFENRDPKVTEDLDGNDISWKICDDLVEMGLLFEDEEAHDLFYDITSAGNELLEQFSSKN